MHINPDMLDSLRCIYQYDSPMLMRNRDNLFYRIDRPQRIRDISYSNQLRSFVNKVLIGVHIELPLIIHRNNTDLTAFFITEHLPRNNIGVVLHCRNNNFISRMDKCSAIAGSNQIDTIGRPLRDNHLLVFRRINKRLKLFTGHLKSICRYLAEVVNSTMYITIHICIIMCNGIDYRIGLLCCRTIVQINQRLAIYLSF
ncbi:hypothetical protein D3C86_1104650 [compost metagenome]